ncbi:MAG: NADH-quinone oxidoreductase subunit A [Armatimonadetes bacterium]|nr:NADH-quinone oxidoreductase subunit A [Armatimonadota bacterium]
MQNNYAYIGLLVIIGVAFCVIAMWLSWALRPTHKSVGSKRETYECGEVPFGDAWKQFRIGYYIFALVFVIFDVEAVFIFPWAAVLKSLKAMQFGHINMAVFAFIEMMIFIAILLIGLIYAWWKGVLRWE